jgi:hypothetical protein
MSFLRCAVVPSCLLSTKSQALRLKANAGSSGLRTRTDPAACASDAWAPCLEGRHEGAKAQRSKKGDSASRNRPVQPAKWTKWARRVHPRGGKVDEVDATEALPVAAKWTKWTDGAARSSGRRRRDARRPRLERGGENGRRFLPRAPGAGRLCCFRRLVESVQTSVKSRGVPVLLRSRKRRWLPAFPASRPRRYRLHTLAGRAARGTSLGPALR